MAVIDSLAARVVIASVRKIESTNNTHVASYSIKRISTWRRDNDHFHRLWKRLLTKEKAGIDEAVASFYTHNQPYISVDIHSSFWMKGESSSIIHTILDPITNYRYSTSSLNPHQPFRMAISNALPNKTPFPMYVYSAFWCQSTGSHSWLCLRRL